ncbi:MAG: hypothetical protein AUG49_26205 [Catenulispora sp. 13_1_20CM_3_70_7]|nr:MAG: hypothetical protein AUG49_26205 [Catenulispora sp. 13_1_20CM_3_70_7]
MRHSEICSSQAISASASRKTGVSRPDLYISARSTACSATSLSKAVARRCPASRIPRQPGDSKPEPLPSTVRISWKSHGDRCRSIRSWSVISSTASAARASSSTAGSSSSARIRASASASSAPASFSHSSVDWCTTWNSSSSRCTRSSGPRCSDNNAPVRM